jgi:hypothetical protein
MSLTKLLTSKTTIFALGATAVPLVNVLVPAVGNALRPLLKEVIKGGIVAGRAMQTMAQEAWQDVEDLTAEAQAEVNSKEKSENGTTNKSSRGSRRSNS